MAARHLPDAPQVALRGRNHPRRALNQRLDDHCRQRIRVSSHQISKFLGAIDATAGALQAERATITIRRRSAKRGKQERSKKTVKSFNIANADITERVAVIGAV